MLLSFMDAVCSVLCAFCVKLSKYRIYRTFSQNIGLFQKYRIYRTGGMTATRTATIATTFVAIGNHPSSKNSIIERYDQLANGMIHIMRTLRWQRQNLTFNASPNATTDTGKTRCYLLIVSRDLSNSS